MPSVNKTENYGLNQWQGNEYLKRIDLNSDNAIIDTELKNVNDKADGKISKSLATAASQFLISTAAGQWAVKTIAEIKTLLGLKGAAEKDFDAAGGVAAYDTVQSHLSDYVRQPGYGVTAGSANTYTLTLNPAPAAYVDGMGIVVKINAANTGAATVNVNGLGAKAIVDSKGNVLSSGKLRLNGTYSLKYNSTSGNFQLLGEGGEIPKLPNLIKDGSFETGANVWTFTGSAVVVSTGAKFGAKAIYHNGTGAVTDYVAQAIPVKIGHKYLFSAWIKNLSNVGTAIDISLKGSTMIPPSTEYTFGSVYYIATADEVLNFVVGWHNVVSNGGGVWIDGIMLLDLTEAFGAGKEPTKEEIDTSIQANGGWWDSDLALLTADATLLDGYALLPGWDVYSKGKKIKGLMPVKTPDQGDQVNALNVNTGAYSGDGQNCAYMQFTDTDKYFQGVRWARSIQPDLLPQNIVAGKNIMGVEGTYNGKKWAKGSAVLTTETKVFRGMTGSTYNIKAVVVTGLNFKPSTVIIKYEGSTFDVITLYSETDPINGYPKSVRLSSYSGDTQNTTNYKLKGDVDDAYVIFGGFSLPINLSASGAVPWEAYE